MDANKPLRQAVVLVHGIGEQRPMQTLQGFVEGLFFVHDGRRRWWSRRCKHTSGGATRARFHSKPDKLTDTLELRRLALVGSDVERPTDFYELYWAHLMHGTAWSHLSAWLTMLMWRWPAAAHWRVKTLWFVAWALVVAGVAAAVIWHRRFPDQSPQEWLGNGLIVALVAALASWLANKVCLHYIGDAARYLSATPQNIGARKDIRNAVIQVLAKLHDEESRRYDRIVVVGHSLGSVIAYDALTHLWQQRHSVIAKPPCMCAQPKLALERLAARTLCRQAADRTNPPLYLDTVRNDFRAAQQALWTEQRQMGVDWRISDLVTIGSPLTHARFLLAGSGMEWAQMVRERVYPTCPPQRKDARDRGLLVRRFFDGACKVHILHHAALFACTRWTNLYYASDPIGGPVGGCDRFGPGVSDVPIPPSGWQSRTLLAHVRYWSRGEEGARAALLDALDLRIAPKHSA